MNGSAAPGPDGLQRCWWSLEHPLSLEYHDREWGQPVADDRRIFEKLCLEGFQSGLSWLTILRKRENFRAAFKQFDMETVARFNTRSVDRLLLDAGIVRHRGKIEAAINNARRCIELAEDAGSLSAYVWSYEPPEREAPREQGDLMTTCPEAIALSKDLKRRGWAFVGPTTVYALMEAVGLVNDHLNACDARERVERARAKFRRPQLRRPPLTGYRIGPRHAPT